jgi:uncharacterized protein with von Willebrand factor type A (vWA) domain
MQGAKLDAVKKATADAIDALDATDEVAIVAFDSEVSRLIDRTSIKDKKRVLEKLAKLQSGGGTNIFPGIKDAKDIAHDSKLGTKHVILLSDGEAPSDGLVDMVKELRKEKATLSAVAIPGADMTLLESLVKEGGGRIYDVKDLTKLSATFVTETKIAFK